VTRKFNIFRQISIILWAAILLAGLGSYIYAPQAFTPERIASFLERFQAWILATYFVFSVLRGFTLLPSTPLVIAGTLLFPSSPWLVLLISVTGILVSSTLIYFCSDWLGFTDYFETKHSKTVEKIRHRLETPAGFLFVLLWAFFPLVPTDAVCYVAGTTRMRFTKFLLAVFLGEVVLCSLYIFLGGYVRELAF
jgi:uncharacterized membrane protein YdjX (TVP38/TMEM64 family)